MTPLSPLDALGPAFRRTREVLAQPFRLGFFLKIALVGALTQPSFYSASVSYPVQGLQFSLLRHAGHRSTFTTGSHFLPTPGLAAYGVAALLIALVAGGAIWVVAAYLYCRLRFTLFDLVVYKRGGVRQAWSAYRRQAWRYFGVVILVVLATMVIAVLVVGPTLVNFMHAVRPLINAGSQANPLAALGAMLPFLLSIFAVGLVWAVVDALMQDFLLPPMAIEDAPIEASFSRLFALLKTNFGPVAIYILLRFAVSLGITWLLMLALFLVLLFAGLAIFAVGALLYHALWATVLGQVICVALAIVVGLIVLAMYVMAAITIYGIAAIFKQSYAAYFYGGRYAALGERLEPSCLAAIPVDLHLPMAPPESFPPMSGAPPVW